MTSLSASCSTEEARDELPSCYSTEVKGDLVNGFLISGKRVSMQ